MSQSDTGYMLRRTIKEASQTIAAALREKPRLVVVPIIVNGPITDEQMARIADAIKYAFEEVL